MFGVVSSKYYDDDLTSTAGRLRQLEKAIENILADMKASGSGSGSGSGAPDLSNSDVIAKSLEISNPNNLIINNEHYTNILNQYSLQTFTYIDNLQFQCSPIFARENGVDTVLTHSLLAGRVSMDKAGKIDIQLNGNTRLIYIRTPATGALEHGQINWLYENTDLPAGNTNITSLSDNETVSIWGAAEVGTGNSTHQWFWKVEGVHFCNSSYIRLTTSLLY